MTSNLERPEAVGEPPPGSGRWRFWGLLLLIGSLAWLGRSSAVREPLEQFVDWMKSHPGESIPLFLLVYLVATVLMVPGSALTVISGAVYGLWLGGAISLVAATLGASAAFGLSRFLVRDWALRRWRESARFVRILRLLEQRQWKIIFLLRLSPLIPFNLLNYFLGVAPVRFGPYLSATFLGMLPGAFLFAWLGKTGGDLLEGKRQPSQWILLFISIASTLILAGLLARWSRRQLEPPREV